jgi:hypothetical protein
MAPSTRADKILKEGSEEVFKTSPPGRILQMKGQPAIALGEKRIASESGQPPAGIIVSHPPDNNFS